MVRSALAAEDRAFLDAAVQGAVPANEFRHHQHVRLAFVLVQAFDPETARLRLGSILKSFAIRNEAPDLYHETLTCAWLALVLSAASGRRWLDFDEFARFHPRLLEKDALATYYSPELLATRDSKERFVGPDRSPLPD
jgi:hypothetical protein